MRLWIAAFLLLLFACQALPLSMPGKTSTKVQLSVADDDACGSSDDDGDAPDIGKHKKDAPSFEKAFLQNSTQISAHFIVPATRGLFLHKAEHLSAHYAAEVATPPPDFC